MLRRALGLLLVLASPAFAQGWETFQHDLGAGAAVCPYDEEDTGAFFCFAVACLPGDPTPLIRVGISGEEIDSDTVPLQVQVDGESVARLFLTRIEGEGMQDFAIAIDRERDADLIESLRAGREAKLIFGIGLNAVVQDISLSGSQTTIDRVAGLCGAAPLLDGEED